MAYYRQGKWKEAVEALETGLRQPHPDTSRGSFFLAMSRAHLGDPERARQAYAEAVGWMAKNGPRSPELGRWRAEAEAVLKASGVPQR